MKNNTHDFIEVFPNGLDEDACELSIKECKSVIRELRDTAIHSKNDGYPSWVRDDECAVVTPSLANHLPSEMTGKLLSIIHRCYQQYMEKYWVLQRQDPLFTRIIKFHWVKPGGGYHQFHSEDGDLRCADRQLVWHLSLNDCPDEGSLEFLYYKRQVFPKAGQLTMWPAAFTHVHRGNPVKTLDKFYFTGWLHLAGKVE